MKLATILTLLIVSLFSLSCISTSVRGRWVEGQESVRFTGLLVYMEAEEVVREQVEGDLARVLARQGVPAETSIVFMKEPRAYSPAEISESMVAGGLDGFLRVRLEDFHTEGREVYHTGGVLGGAGFLVARRSWVSLHERTRLSLRLDLLRRPGGPLVWTARGRARSSGRPSLRRLVKELGSTLAARIRRSQLIAAEVD